MMHPIHELKEIMQVVRINTMGPILSSLDLASFIRSLRPAAGTGYWSGV